MGVTVTIDLGGCVISVEGFYLLEENIWRECTDAKATEHFDYRHRTCELVFETEDLNAILERVMRYPARTLMHPAKQGPWGQRGGPLF